MPTAWVTFPIHFEKGWITNMGKLEQGTQLPGSATKLENFEPSVEGGYKKVLGYEKFSDTAVTGSGQIICSIIVDATTCLTSRDDIYYKGTGTTWTSVLAAASGGATKARHDVFNYNGTEKIVVVDGVNDPAYYLVGAGTMSYDTSAPSDVTGATIVRNYKNHLFAKGPLLSYTAPYDELDYTVGNGAGVVNIGADITGLILFREQLVIFAVDKIFILTGSTSADFALETVADRTGCLSPDTVREIGGDILYLGPDGVRFLSATIKNDDFGLDRASQNIQDIITPLSASTATFASVVIRSKSQYRLFPYFSSLPAEDSVGYIMTKFSDQSVDNVSWSSTLGIRVYCTDSRQFAAGEVILFANDNGFIYIMETGSQFDGNDIGCIFETPFMPITDPRIRKTLYKHSLYANVEGTLDLGCSIQLDYSSPNIIQPDGFTIGSVNGAEAIYGSASAIYDTAFYSEPGTEIYVDMVVGSGFTFSLRYADYSSNPSFQLTHAILEYTQNERR